VTSVDVQTLPQHDLRSDPFLWKSAFRGTPCDSRLLSRLQELPSLDQVLSDAMILQRRDRGRGVTFGKGRQKSALSLVGSPFVASSSADRYHIDVSGLSLFERPTVASRSNRLRLKLPVLLAFRSLRGERCCVAFAETSHTRTHLVFDQTYYGMSFADAPVWLARRLNAVLNSKMVLYLAFMLSPAFGWDRRLIEVQDWLNIPLPRSVADGGAETGWAAVLAREEWLRLHCRPNAADSLAARIPDTEDELDQEIFGLYDLSPSEVTLIEDTIRYTIRPFLRRAKGQASATFGRPDLAQLHAYARQLSRQLDGILRYGGLELTTSILVANDSPINAFRFTVGARTGGDLMREVEVTGADGILNGIAQDLRAEVAQNLYVQRDLRVYDGQSFWIIKPAERRLWTEAAALNDADAVVREHMEAAVHA